MHEVGEKSACQKRENYFDKETLTSIFIIKHWWLKNLKTFLGQMNEIGNFTW